MKPATLGDLRAKRARCRVCKSRPWHNGWMGIIECLCKGKSWNLARVLGSWSDADVGAVFYVESDPVGVSTRLVWVDEGRDRFLKEVPYDPNETREIFKP